MTVNVYSSLSTLILHGTLKYFIKKKFLTELTYKFLSVVAATPLPGSGFPFSCADVMLVTARSRDITRFCASNYYHSTETTFLFTHIVYFI